MYYITYYIIYILYSIYYLINKMNIYMDYMVITWFKLLK